MRFWLCYKCEAERDVKSSIMYSILGRCSGVEVGLCLAFVGVWIISIPLSVASV